ncbi:MAG: antirestriction protein ArdA [Anaerolineaceae bacterium]|nr:antirestriction protein ArdA [Anaerolineaceae bacterium]
MTKNEPTTRIYVACLASYNNGILHGAWIDADQDAESIFADVQTMLAASPMSDAEEWAIHDYEGFYGCSLSESEGFEQVSKLAMFLAEQGRLGAELVSHFGGSLDEARQALEENYCGEYTSLADFAEELTAETVIIPIQLVYYIDYKAMWSGLGLRRSQS